MEIHGNAFTVWSVLGTEYQSSVSSGDCPFRPHYLKDGNIALRPHRLTECQHYKRTGLRLHCFLSALKVNAGKREIRCFPPPFEPLECNPFNFNSTLITILFAPASAVKLNKVQFFWVLTSQWLVMCTHLLCCCQRCQSSLRCRGLRGSNTQTGA